MFEQSHGLRIVISWVGLCHLVFHFYFTTLHIGVLSLHLHHILRPVAWITCLLQILLFPLIFIWCVQHVYFIILIFVALYFSCLAQTLFSMLITLVLLSMSYFKWYLLSVWCLLLLAHFFLMYFLFAVCRRLVSLCIFYFDSFHCDSLFLLFFTTLPFSALSFHVHHILCPVAWITRLQYILLFSLIILWCMLSMFILFIIIIFCCMVFLMSRSNSFQHAYHISIIVSVQFSTIFIFLVMSAFICTLFAHVFHVCGHHVYFNIIIIIVALYFSRLARKVYHSCWISSENVHMIRDV